VNSTWPRSAVPILAAQRCQAEEHQRQGDKIADECVQQTGRYKIADSAAFAAARLAVEHMGWDGAERAVQNFMRAGNRYEEKNKYPGDQRGSCKQFGHGLLSCPSP